MADFHTHIAFAGLTGVAYGAGVWHLFGVDPATAAVSAGLTTFAGMLPDLDSDSGTPVRELFGIAAVLVPLMCLRRLVEWGLSPEEIILCMAGLYFGVRHGVRGLFKRVTIHRGMFHSIPAVGVAGLVVFTMSQHPFAAVRGLFALGVMLGYLSHLILDEIYSVDLGGVIPKLKKSAGSALKFASPSRRATMLTYIVLAALLLLAVVQLEPLVQTAGRPDVAEAPGQRPQQRARAASPDKAAPPPMQVAEREVNPDAPLAGVLNKTRTERFKWLRKAVPTEATRP